jgi:hypothetical protein
MADHDHDAYELNEPGDESQIPEQPDPIDQLVSAAPPAAAHHADDGPPTDAHGRLLQNAFCLTCGYNLRGQPLTGLCPECGSPVETSAHGDLLRYADPQWLSKLVTGITWLLISSALAVGGGCLMGGIVGALGVNNPPPQPSPTNPLAQPVPDLTTALVTTIFTAVISLAFLYGYERLTTPEPGRIETGWTIRSVARWAAFIMIGLGLFNQLLTLLSVWAPSLVLVTSIIGIIGLVPVAAWLYAMPTWLQKLAGRVPDTSLAKQMGIIKWIFIASIPVSFLLGIAIVVAVASNPSATAGFAALGLLGCIAAPIMLGVVIWLIVLLFIYRSRFATALQAARHNAHV